VLPDKNSKYLWVPGYNAQFFVINPGMASPLFETPKSQKFQIEEPSHKDGKDLFEI